MPRHRDIVKIITGLLLSFGATKAGADRTCAPNFARLSVPQRFQTYRSDTLEGIEKMRNPETGLVRDKILVLRARDGPKIRVLNNNTSGTNIGIDLINQLGELSHPAQAVAARKRLESILSSLEKMDRHGETGLFYSWYSTESSLAVMNRDVSSVDNIHLALALWATKETQPSTELGRRAGKLFDQLDFSKFYDQKTGLMGGNLKFDKGAWSLERYRFDNAGSEARSIYSLTWALGLLRSRPDTAFPAKSVKALKVEVFSWADGDQTGRILRTWDGGAFQLLLPKLLINEEKYSPELGRSFSSFGRYIISEGKRQGFEVPAAHSASNYGIDGFGFSQVPVYEGRAGSPALVSTDHVDLADEKLRKHWDIVFTPHAAVMAATTNPSEMAPRLAAAEKLRSGRNQIYVSGFGFMDGYHVKGLYKGQVVPVQLSLDQGMIVLASDQIGASDGMGTTGRLLNQNDAVRSRLQEFYQLLDAKLAQTK